MGDFLIAFKITNDNEGGYSFDKDDRGQETALGISRKFWPNWIGWRYIDAYKAANGLHNIDHFLFTDPDVQAARQSFYRANFWTPLRLDQINDQQIANAVYDMAVNSGIHRSAELLQRSAGVTVDGIIGQQSIAAINNGNPAAILTEFDTERKAFYLKLAEEPGQAKFLTSWLSRIKPYKTA